MASDQEQMAQMMVMMQQIEQSKGHRKRPSKQDQILQDKAKQDVMKAFDEIDLEDNGDIEFDEFQTGMHKLNVSLTTDEIKQVFNLMDSDGSKYVDRNEFTMFLWQQFESTELRRFQDAILRKIGIGGLVQDEEENENEIKTEEENLYKEMEKQAKEQENFGKIENVKNWNRFEVAHWIDVEVKLNEYMTSFMKAHVDGNILLSDLNRDILIMDIGVKRVHVEKIMRGIVELRDKIRTEWDESECFDIIPYPILNDERAIDKIATYFIYKFYRFMAMQKIKIMVANIFDYKSIDKNFQEISGFFIFHILYIIC